MNKRSCFYVTLAIGFCTLLSFSCEVKDPVDGIIISQVNDFAAEQEFLEQLLSQPDFTDALGLRLIREGGRDEREPAKKSDELPSLAIDFTESWTQADGIPVSKKWFVPKENMLMERTGASLTACLEGKETLVPIEEIAPPYIGLLVDGLCASDENYPLVRYVSLNIREVQDGAGKNSRLQKKIADLETALAQAPKPLVKQTPSIVWICAAGDLMLERESGDILIKEGAAGIMGKTAEYFKRSDLNLINLEGSVSTRGVKAAKSFTFRFDPKTVPALKTAGMHAVLLANNHSFDYGETAFLDTLDYLEKDGIAALGAGRDINAAASPFIFTTEQIEIRVFGLASFPVERTGWNGANVSATEKRAGMLYNSRVSVEHLKENFVQKDDVLNVLLFHGGYEWSWRPEPSTRRLYTDLARSGADLIIGTHPHTVQGFEWLDGKLIFWSLGDYVFAGMENTDGGEEGLLIRLGYMGKTPLYFEPVPVKITGPRSDIGPAEQLKSFYALSRELNKGLFQ